MNVLKTKCCFSLILLCLLLYFCDFIKKLKFLVRCGKRKKKIPENVIVIYTAYN